MRAARRTGRAILGGLATVIIVALIVAALCGHRGARNALMALGED